MPSDAVTHVPDGPTPDDGVPVPPAGATAATAVTDPATPDPASARDAGRTAPTWGDPADPVAPSREDPTAASASQVVGGPLGRHAIVGSTGVAAALAVVSGAVTALVAGGVVERAHCIQQGWTSPDHFWHACYSDVPVVYDSSGLARGIGPFDPTSTLAQPLPTAVLAWLVARVVPSGTGLAEARWYFALWSVLAVACLVGVAAALVRSQPRHPWRVAHLASPALPFLALASFEVVPVTLAALGVAAWSARRRALAGVLLGLAALARPWSVLVLAAVVLLAVRTGALRSAATTVGAALLTAGGLVAVTALAGGGAALDAYSSWWSSPAGYGSPWYVANLLGATLPTGVLTAVSVLGWVLALGAGAYLALVPARRPRLGELVLVMTMIAALTGRSLPVQAGLWVVVLLAVVGVRWRLHLAWAAVEVAYFVAVWLHIAATSAPDRGLPAGWFAVFLVARLVAWAWVLVDVWRRAASRPAALVVEHPDAAVGAASPGGASGPALDPALDPAAGSVESAERAGGAHRPDTVAAAAHPHDRVAVVEDDDLAGPLAGRTDHTVITFV